ncbi:hypothetical protein [Holdemanella biformis]
MPARTKTVKQTDAELAPFANNSHETEYTRMMHRYADLDKREKALRRKQCFANWMLFASVVLVIGCVIATAFVCTTIQSIRL